MARSPKRPAIVDAWTRRDGGFRAILFVVALLVGFSFADCAGATASTAWTAFGRGTAFAPNAVPGLSDPTDNPRSIAFDFEGNAYVTGTRFIEPYNTVGEFLTIKYNKANGAIEWRAFAGAEVTALSAAAAISVDAQGSAYVTGGAATSVDGELRIAFLTLKYDSHGAEVWRAQGVAPNDARAKDIAIDAQGNVYVAGFVFVPQPPSFAPRLDYLTIKYDANGTELWRATAHDAVTNYSHLSMGLDAGGNVYVAASSDTTGHLGYFAVSYDSTGAERWRVNPKLSSTSDDYFSAAAVDAAGNVYLTGGSLDGNNSRFFTIKFDRNGVEQWRILGTDPTGGGSSIAVDAGGNVYVAASIASGFPNGAIVTIKYDSNGIRRWRTVSAGAGSQGLGSFALAVDASQNAYVAGWITNDTGGHDHVTIKYGLGGVEQWRATASGGFESSGEANAIAVDAAGTTYVTGRTFVIEPDDSEAFDWLTLKYNAAGNEQWHATEGFAWTAAIFGSNTSNAAQRAMATDGQGSVYVTGYVQPVHPLDSFDFLTIKFDSNGAELWRALADSPGLQNLGRAITLDGGRNVYVTGSSQANDTAYLTVKYSSSGAELWRQVSHNAEGSADTPTRVAADAQGNVFVSGYSYQSTASDYFTVKLDASGVEQWRQMAHGVLQGFYYATGFAVDAAGNSYVTGIGTDQATTECLTIAYAPDGTERWRASSNDASSRGVQGGDVVIGASGVYVTALADNGATSDFLTIKYSFAGAELWRARSHGDALSAASVSAVAVDSFDSAFVAGTVYNGIDYDILVVKYNSAGGEWWRTTIGHVAAFSDGPVAPALALDSAGGPYVSGNERAAPRGQYLIVKYNTAGFEEWRYTSGDPARNLGAYAIALAPGGIYVAGNSIGPNGPPSMLLRKIVGTGSPSTTLLNLAPNPSRLGQPTTLSANVTGGFPTGTVSFTNEDFALPGCSLAPLATGRATCVTTALTIGQHALAATYSGDSNIVASKSSTLVHEVLPALTTTTLTSSRNPSAPGDSTTFTANVAGQAPDGTVMFTDAGVTMAGCGIVPMNGGRATCTSSTLQLGKHPIVATYSGDEDNEPSVSATFFQNVLPASSTTLTSSLNPSLLGQVVTFTATVLGNSPTGGVDFRDGAAILCAGVALAGKKGPKTAKCATSALAAGLHDIIAVYSGDSANAVSASSPLVQTVNGPQPGTSITSSRNPSAPGSSVTFTATVTGNNPGGSVDFRDGANQLCSAVPLQGAGNARTAQCSTSLLAVGTHSITAAYTGDASNPPSSSSVLTQTVKLKR